MIKLFLRSSIGIMGMMWLLSSCGTVANLQYLQGSFDTTQLSLLHYPEPVIQKGDLLGVSVLSDDATATAAVVGGSTFTKAVGLAEAQGRSDVKGGGFELLVDDMGMVTIYKLGKLKVEGMTRKQFMEKMNGLYVEKQLLVNPQTEVKFLNYKVTMIGEVGKPGPISVPGDRINAFEAIGLAGDITVTGRRDNVLVVRETNGVRTFGRLNLQDPNVYQSPYFYLQQNDLVVVDVAPMKANVNNQTTLQYASLAVSALSVLALIFNVFRN